MTASPHSPSPARPPGQSLRSARKGRSRFRFRGGIAALAGAVLSFVPPAGPVAWSQAGGATVDATLLSRRLPLGEQTPLIVRVINGRVEAIPDTLSVEGLTITRSPRVEQKMSIGAGGTQTEYHLYYTVEASRAGEFTIPAITVRVDGRDHSTAPVSLTVYERDPADPALDATRPYFANLECQTREAWAGQMVPVTLAIYVRGARSINDVGPPMLRHDAFVFAYDRTYTLDGVELDGTTFSTAKRPGSVFGLTPGRHSIGPAELQVAMIDESSPFGRMPGFFQSFVAKTLRTNPLDLTVKPLPEAGKPATFKGAVGRFSVAVKASPLTLAVGDPITLDFEVKGPGNYELLEAPVLMAADPAQWRAYDARKIVDPAERSDGATSGRATFTQIVMPQAQVAEIPAFELSYFNPETGAYESQRTAPVPIQVAPDSRPAAGTGGVAISPAAAGPGAGASAPPPGGYVLAAAATPEAQFRDILHIRTGDPRWRPKPAALTRRPAFWIGQAVPALTLLSLLGIGLVRRVGRKTDRDRRDGISFKAATAAVAGAATRGEFHRALLFALDRWAAEAGPAAERALPADLKRATAALRARAQDQRYGAAEADRHRPPDPGEAAEAARLLAALRRHRP